MTMTSPAGAQDAEPAVPVVRRAAGEWERLVGCFAAASPVSLSHWNPTTGEVFAAPRGRQSRATARAFEQRLLTETGWVEVPWLESSDAFALAAAFGDSLGPGRGRVDVLTALAGEKPFRALRRVLDAHPGLRRRYEREVKQEAAFRLVHTCLALGWDLDHPEFARWSREVMEIEREDAVQTERASTPERAVESVSVPVRALRIGRAAGTCTG